MARRIPTFGRILATLSLGGLLALGAAGCVDSAVVPPVPTPATAPIVAPSTAAPQATPLARPNVMLPGEAVPANIVATAVAVWGPGGTFVAKLPRPNDLPAGWLLSASPRYEERTPEPGDTYSFACQALPARSVGVASIGYRQIEGLPGLSVEYVVYNSAEDASAALEDMRRAATACPDFVIELGGAVGEVAATIEPLQAAELGDGSFAMLLQTSAALTGDLTTRVFKVRQDNVVIGINHSALTGEPVPGAALGEAVARLAIRYLDGVN